MPSRVVLLTAHRHLALHLIALKAGRRRPLLVCQMSLVDDLLVGLLLISLWHLLRLARLVGRSEVLRLLLIAKRRIPSSRTRLPRAARAGMLRTGGVNLLVRDLLRVHCMLICRLCLQSTQRGTLDLHNVC